MAYVKCLMNVISSTIPDGKTVTPTDDVSILLACAGRTETYTTISALLADATALAGVINSNNAIDYLVRSTTFASDVCANQGAMTDIGASNYASNTLLANNTWLTAICGSMYFESVLNVKVPVMTSDTTPSGICSASSVNVSGTTPAWKAFDGDDSTIWGSGIDQITNQWLTYQFASAQSICMAVLTNVTRATNIYLPANCKIQYTSSYTDVKSFVNSDAPGASTKVIFDAPLTSEYWRLFMADNTGNRYIQLAELQFYGRANV